MQPAYRHQCLLWTRPHAKPVRNILSLYMYLQQFSSFCGICQTLEVANQPTNSIMTHLVTSFKHHMKGFKKCKCCLFWDTYPSVKKMVYSIIKHKSYYIISEHSQNVKLPLQMTRAYYAFIWISKWTQILHSSAKGSTIKPWSCCLPSHREWNEHTYSVLPKWLFILLLLL